MASFLVSRSTSHLLRRPISTKLHQHLCLCTSLAHNPAEIDPTLQTSGPPNVLHVETAVPDPEVVVGHQEIHTNSDKPEDAICRMISTRGWVNRLQHSVRALVPQFDAPLVLNVIQGVRKPGHALHFFRWVQESNLFQHDRQTYGKMIEILCRASFMNEASRVFMDMGEKGVPWDEDLFVMLIEGFGEDMNAQKSISVFDSMEDAGIVRTHSSYDSLMKALLSQKEHALAEKYFDQMMRDGVNPTCETYNVLIWGSFHSQKVDTAERFFREMKEQGIFPDVSTYNSMIYQYNKVGKMEEASKMLAEMKESGIKPNDVTYTSLVKGYMSASSIDDGLRMYKEMKSAGIEPNEFTYAALLPGLCDAKNRLEAKTVFAEMADKHIVPKDKSIFLELVACHCESNDVDSAIDVLSAMDEMKIPAEAGHYGILIEFFCKSEAYDCAVKLLDKLIEKDIVLKSRCEMEPLAYNPIISYLCTNGQTEKAETFFRQLMKKGVLDSAAFNELIRGHVRDGSPERANELLKIMDRRGIPREAESYSLLVDGYMKKGEPADAKTVLDSMLENGHVPEPALFRSVMDSLLADGRVQTASRVMKSMLEKGVNENMDLAEKILEGLLLRGHVDEAIGRTGLVLDSGMTPNFNSLLSVLCEQRKTYAALKLLDFGLERDCNIESMSYKKVLDALVAVEKFVHAYAVLCKLFQKGGDFEWEGSNDLIKSLQKEGNTRQADILSRMLCSRDEKTKVGGEDEASQKNKVKKQASAARDKGDVVTGEDKASRKKKAKKPASVAQ